MASSNRKIRVYPSLSKIYQEITPWLNQLSDFLTLDAFLLSIFWEKRIVGITGLSFRETSGPSIKHRLK